MDEYILTVLLCGQSKLFASFLFSRFCYKHTSLRCNMWAFSNYYIHCKLIPSPWLLLNSASSELRILHPRVEDTFSHFLDECRHFSTNEGRRFSDSRCFFDGRYFFDNLNFYIFWFSPYLSNYSRRFLYNFKKCGKMIFHTWPSIIRHFFYFLYSHSAKLLITICYSSHISLSFI